MRVVAPSDVGGYLIAQGWGRKVETGHRVGDDRQLVGLRISQLPSTDEWLSEWPSWMRPAWMQPAGRVLQDDSDLSWVPVRCRSCPRYSYVPEDRLPAGTEREPRSDAWLVRCSACRRRA